MIQGYPGSNSTIMRTPPSLNDVKSTTLNESVLIFISLVSILAVRSSSLYIYFLVHRSSKAIADSALEYQRVFPMVGY